MKLAELIARWRHAIFRQEFWSDFFKKSWTFFSFETLLEFWCHLQKQMEAEILGRLQKFLKNSDRESIHY